MQGVSEVLFESLLEQLKERTLQEYQARGLTPAHWTEEAALKHLLHGLQAHADYTAFRIRQMQEQRELEASRAGTP